MVRYFFMIVALFLMQSIDAQKRVDYFYSNKEGHIRFELEFTLDCFWLSVYYVFGAEDQEQEQVIMCGKYLINGNDLTLWDTDTDFITRGKIYPDSMKLFNAVVPLAGKRLINLRQPEYFDAVLFDEIYYKRGAEWSVCRGGSDRVQWLNEYNKQATKQYTVKLGRYSSFSTVARLEIKDGYQYQLTFYDFVLSEGSWFQNGNELILYDKNLKHSFYGYLKEDEIIARYFPMVTGKHLFVLEK